jgi:hypothetical protein
MTDERGYTPPKVEGFSATISPAPAADSLAAAETTRRKVTITLHGEDFIQRAMPLIVKIGDQVVLGNYQVTADERHLTFELDALPEDGAAILIGYGGDELMELPIRFTHEALQESTSDPEV